MIYINLLPWREAQRALKKRKFFTMIATSAIGALLLVIAIKFYLAHQETQQETRNHLLQVEIEHFRKAIKEIEILEKTKQSLIARMTIIQQLQESRPLAVHVFDELVKILPQGIYMLKCERVGQHIDIEGVAESNTSVSLLMRNIETNRWFVTPLLHEIRKDPRDLVSLNHFKLKLTIKDPLVIGEYANKFK